MNPNDQAALWRELAARMPGLKCQCHEDTRLQCGPCDNAGAEASHEDSECEYCGNGNPDLALLLRAAREARWSYSLVHHRAWNDAPNHVQANFSKVIDEGFGTGPDELTAAMLAMKRALDAEKERNHD